MLNGVMWLLVFQFIGEFLARVLHLPVPGPVIGMLLLVVALLLRKPPADAGVLRASDAMLRHLQLFFIPPAVGIITYFAVLRDDWLPIAGGLVLSWLLGLAATGLLVTLLLRGKRGHEEASGEPA
ncbi:CidA/LrgA family protein [Nocardioides alcanivorans]|uniref:CidA/LrgA family protein n=1 Tax=Nocardioides alcanivorans TaxID=2897352 RepID=UPI001F2BEE5B|nr:CidA/LrgA family protein [Nocardioides alcanivorans]